MSKTLAQWIERYNKKISEGFKRDERFAFFYLPEKGFAEIMDDGVMIIVYQVCGDLKFWRGFAEILAQKLERKMLGTICIRNIKAYMRLAGFIPYKTEETRQGARYYAKDKVTGQKGQASPAGEGTYFITWEANSNDI